MTLLRTFMAALNGGEIAPRLYDRTDLAKYQSALKECRNFVVRPEGGARKRDGFEEVGQAAASDDAWVLGFEVTADETYSLEFTTGVLRFVYRGAYVLEAAQHGFGAVANSDIFTRAAHGFTARRCFVTSNDPALDGDFFDIEPVNASSFRLIRANGVAARASFTGAANELQLDYRIATPYTCACAEKLHWAQDQATLYLFSQSHPVHRLTRVAPDNWVLEPETFAPRTPAPAGLAAVATTVAGTASTSYAYKVAAISDATGEESLPSAAVSVSNDLSLAGNFNTLTWSAVPGAVRYLVYKDENGLFGYIGGTEALTFKDENITPDLSDTPQKLRNPFSGPGNYPRTGTFFEQRLWLAATQNDPPGVWASQSTETRNLNVSSPLKADDAISFRLRAARAAGVQALVALSSLVLMTDRIEWNVDASLQEGYLTPTNIVLRPATYWGSSAVMPLLIGNSMIFAPRGGNTVRDWSRDRDGGASSNLAKLAGHLFTADRVKGWAYQQVPDSVIWVVTNTGKLYSLTYVLEDEVWGWAQHPVEGEVLSVAAVAEGDYDALYAVIRRQHAWGTRVSVERMADPRARFHVDGGLRYTGEPTRVVYGFSHFAGQRVAGELDGRVVRDLLVDEQGRVELPYAASDVTLGLPYVGRLRTLNLDLGPQQGAGSLYTRPKSLGEVRLSVLNSGLLWAGQSGSELVEVKRREPAEWGGEAALFSGLIKVVPYAGWNEMGDIVIEARDPRPTEVLSILADWEFAE